MASEAGASEVQEELCRSRTRDLMLAREQAKRPSYAIADFTREYSMDPIKNYNFKNEVRRCEIEMVKKDFDSGEDISRYCEGLKFVYVTDCLRHLVSQQKIVTPQEVVNWADVAADAGKMDARRPSVNPQTLSLAVYETVIIAMEKYADSLKKKARTPASTDSRLEEIRRYEEKVFAELKDQLLKESFNRLDKHSVSGKGNSSFVDEKIREIKERVEKLK